MAMKRKVLSISVTTIFVYNDTIFRSL
jgi:hypothetical protein